MLTRLQTLFNRSLFLCFIFFIHNANLPAKIIDVPTASNPTIQSGINDAQDGDTVLVQIGRYKENLDMKGKNIVLGSLYIKRNAPVFIDETVIDGDGKWSIVVFNKAENAKCELNGFTLINGIGVEHSWDNSRLGGAIYCQQASPSLQNLIITENQADKGSAIYCSRASPIIENVTISKNSGSGGTIHCNYYSNPRISDVIIRENSDNGMYLLSEPKIKKTIITQNALSGICIHATDSDLSEVVITHNRKAGIYASSSYVKLKNVTISNNVEGIRNLQSSIYVENSILWNNNPHEVHVSTLYAPSQHAGLSISYSNIEGGRNGIEIRYGENIYITYDTTNIDSDPLFCDPVNGIYTLAENSPCIGTASNGGNMGALGVGCFEGAALASPEWMRFFLDNSNIILEWRAVINNFIKGYNIYSGSQLPNTLVATTSSRLDTTISLDILDLFNWVPYQSQINFRITAFDSLGREGSASVVRAVLIEVANQFKQIPTILTLYQSFPNPFNCNTVIVYFLPEKQHVTLTLYDLRGARVKKLFSGINESGFNRVEWDGRNDQGISTAQGLYIYQLKTSSEILHRKLIMLK